MKNIICCFTLLFIMVGCKKDNPNAQPTPDNQEQNGQQDEIANANEPQETQVNDPVPRKTITNSIDMKLVYIPPGEFMMGSRDSAEEVARKGTNVKTERFTAEHPQHQVKITNEFIMGATEVSQAQYIAIMGTNPSEFKGEDNPVDTVSWNDAMEFCKKLSEKEGKQYRLPTEAEWEYACRAGTTTPFHTGETIITSQANYNGNFVYGNGAKGIFLIRTTSVGSFPPNDFGLYDMHGNVWEWCSDWYNNSYYSISLNTDPTGPSRGSGRVLRGGSWFSDAYLCRVACRYYYTPSRRRRDIGFRVCLDLN